MKKKINSKKSKPKKLTINERTLGTLQKDKSVETIYIGNLSYNKNEYDLRRMFNKFGSVSYVRLILDTKTEKSKGFAFIQMTNKAHAKQAVTNLNGSQVDGRTIKVSIAKDSEISKKTDNTKIVKKEKIKDSKVIPETKTKNRKVVKKHKKGLEELFKHLKS